MKTCGLGRRAAAATAALGLALVGFAAPVPVIAEEADGNATVTEVTEGKSDAEMLADEIAEAADSEGSLAAEPDALSDEMALDYTDPVIPADTVAAPKGEGRSVQIIDANWYFNTGEDTSTGWTFPVGGESGVISLPHTWSYTHPTMSYIPTMSAKTVSYTKVLDISQVKDYRVAVKFEAASKNLSLFVDGEIVGSHTGGYSAFTFDLTDAIQKALGAGNTTITLRADVTNIDTKTTPVNVDFIQWAGIYRDVELIVTPNQYISTENNGSSGVFVDYAIDGSDASVTTKVDVSNQSADEAGLKIKSSILAADGSVVSEQTEDVTAAASETCQEFKVSQRVQDVHLWNGTADPYLYTSKVELLDAEGNVLDEQSQEFGVRTFEVKNGKTYLNGAELEVHGVGYHQDREGMGYAVSDEQIREDVDTMLEMGVNAVRASHYQHDDYFYQLCNEKGIIVYAEIPFYLIYSKAESFQASVKSQLTELIRQEYNNPCIVMWGVHNELRNLASFKTYGDDFDVSDEEVVAFVESLVDLAKQEDPSRMVVQAIINNTGEATSLFSKWSGDIDLTGLNLYHAGKYNDAGRASLTRVLQNSVDKYKGIFGVDTLMLSEYGAGGTIAQHTELDGSTTISTAYMPEETQAFTHEVYWAFIKNSDDIALSFAWNMFDFSCYRNEGGLSGINTKGMVCFDHATKKDVYYFYKAVWNTEDKFVHLTSKRYTERTKALQQIKAYSNCEKVELFLNGESLGYGEKQQDGVFVWSDVNIAKAEFNELKVVAYDADASGELQQVDGDSVEGVSTTAINPDIADAKVTADEQTYTGSALEPAVKVVLGDKELVKGTDYEVAYDANVNVGTATVTVTGKGDYAGTVKGTFAIKAADASKAKVTVADQDWTGKALQPTVTVTLGDKTLVSGTDYEVAYANNVEAGTASVTVTFKGNYSGQAKGSFTITKKGDSGKKDDSDSTVTRVTLTRLYNPWSGEHLYTSDAAEVKNLTELGWRNEGTAWVAPSTSSTPVYRLYNPFSGDHHYTTDEDEYAKCAKDGWRQEGIAWYSADSSTGTPVYRGFNPYETVGTHHYTMDKTEMDTMKKNGWRDEGIGWYGLK